MEPTRSQSEDEDELHPLGVILSRYKKEKKIPSAFPEIIGNVVQ